VNENFMHYSNQMNMSESNNKNYYENEDDDSKLAEEDRKRNKRRSKNDNDGRSHICQICNKSYLSYPALYTHIKTKHNNNGKSSSRGRGRPKKDNGDTINPVKLIYNPCGMEYFKHPERIGETNETEIDEVLREVFDKIYMNEDRMKNTRIKQYTSFDQHPFMQLILEHYQSPKTLDPEKSKCNEVFADYLCKIARVSRKEVFAKFVTFITLFRESLNSMNKKDNLHSGDYTQEYVPEDAPDISNEFVTEFLESDSSFFDFQKDEVIDITQNFCQWLYDNNYTCSKLSLINNM